jgi:glycosyltransferase involved in cell wall biosynthesis
MPKKKILHITQDTGGVKTYVTHILDYADQENFEFAIVAPQNDSFQQHCKDRSISYYPVNLHRGNNPIKNTAELFQIISAIKKEKPDLVHAHSAKGGFLGRLAAKLTGTKVIYTPHAFSYLPFTGSKRTAFFSLELMARKWTTLLLAISHSEAQRAIYEVGYNKSKVKVILNSIPVPSAPVLLDPPSAAINIRMVGRLTNQKNHLLFLEVANVLLKKYPQLQFSILGAGIHDDLTDEINSYLDNNNLKEKIQIEHWGDSAKSRQFLQEADIFVMTSIFEGLPFSLLEAMSLGKACVVSAVDGNKDVIHNNENGFICSSLDDFCQKIELLINNDELRRQIGMAGYDYVQKVHNIKDNTKKLEAIYKTLA